MNSTSTGSESAESVQRPAEPRIVRGGSFSGDAYTPTLTTPGTRSTGETSLEPVRSKRTPARVQKVTPKVKHTCFALFTACIDNIDRALDHNEDLFLRSNALDQLKDTLSELWNVRSKREEQFAEIVNMLQGIFAQRTVEDFTTNELDVLRLMLRQLRDEGVYDDDFVNAITVDLLNGGIDVFREIE